MHTRGAITSPLLLPVVEQMHTSVVIAAVNLLLLTLSGSGYNSPREVQFIGPCVSLNRKELTFFYFYAAKEIEFFKHTSR